MTSLFSNLVSKATWMLLVAIALLCVILLTHPTVAAESAVDHTKDQSSFRLSRLETEVRGLRSQLQQLESQLNRVQRNTSGGSVSLSSPVESGLSSDQTQPGSDLQFDQLATLVIETRQDVFAVQDRVAAIEQALSGDGEAVP